MDILYEMFEGMPRGGPGNNQMTRRAYEMVSDLPPAPEIIDIGCGPGMQTLELARISGGHVTALDNHPPFLERLNRDAAAAGLDSAITTTVGDMAALAFPTLSDEWGLVANEATPGGDPRPASSMPRRYGSSLLTRSSAG